MARIAVYVTMLLVTVSWTSAYEKQCANGPQHWCQSLQNAKDCGAIQHCTDTVWKHDNKYTNFESSTTCEWCQKIIENSHKGIQHLANNEDSIKSSVENGCRLFPLETLSKSCSNMIEQYGIPVSSLLKSERYATVCYLMNMCALKTIPQSPQTDESSLLVGQKRCTWGPSYWCSSLSNSRECNSIEHCSSNIWSKQVIEQPHDDNICKFCAFTMDKLRTIVEDNKTLIDVKTWLTGACAMLQSKSLVDECTLMVTEYATEVLRLVKTNIDSGVICHLAHMCKDATIKTRETVSKVEKVPITNIEYKPALHVPIDEESKMMCHVIVRATHDLYVNQNQNRAEIQSFLFDDCQKMPNLQLIGKCQSFIHQHGTEIFAHVASNVELSKICDYFDGFVDNSIEKELPPVHCELCRFVLATAKYMVDGKYSEENVLSYVDEQVCSRFTTMKKKNCQQLLLNKGKELMTDIRSGAVPALLCTRFQVCLNEVFEGEDAIPKPELQHFIKNNLCDKMGTMRDACHAVMEPNNLKSVQTLVQDLEGDILCRLFGLCPKRLSSLDDLSINDDTNKCKRCIDDFTRRKHISEKLVNHSAEFLRHLCSQLPEKDKCTQAVDDSIQELIDFVRALDPQEICVELKMCDSQTIKNIEPTKLDTANLEFEHQIIERIKVEFCTKMGEMAALCNKTMDTEGPAILLMISKEIDPKKACATMGICPATDLFDNCNDKCDCCVNRMKTHETQVKTFLGAMVQSVSTLCRHMPDSNSCRQMTEKWTTKIDDITSKFNSRAACELLTHCSMMPIEIETLDQCRSQMNSKKDFLDKSIKTLNQNLKSLCEYIPWNKDCYNIIDRSTYDVDEAISALNTETLCISKRPLNEVICRNDSPFNKLCQELIVSDENRGRLEALFISMFNQNGRVEEDLCELDVELVSSNLCKPTFNAKVESNRCDSCNQHYTDKKSYNLLKIEKLREGLLLTCDWSLTKDHCIHWFNRVCDRMKAKVNDFDARKYCKNTLACNEESITKTECSMTGDKCQCCTESLAARKDRFRSVINELTVTLSSACDRDDCRSSVGDVQKQTLDQIDRININILCGRYGYCDEQDVSKLIEPRSRLSDHPRGHVGSSIEALPQRLESALTSDICFQYGQLKSHCEHLLASINAQRNAYIYRAFLHKNSKLFDDDLREQLATPPSVDVCLACKSAVQSAKDYWMTQIDTVRDALIQSCERCPAKAKCKTYFEQQYEIIKTYVKNINGDQFCQSLRLCSATPQIETSITGTLCTTCVERLNQRKITLRLGLDRLTNYLSDVCQRFELKPCQAFMEQLQQSFKTTIDSWNTQEICTQIGFCTTTDPSTWTSKSFDDYESYVTTQIETQICSELGPLQSWCRQILHGNREQIQTVKINENFRDLMQIGASKDENLLSAVNLYRCENDRCQCCVDRITQKKEYLKSSATQVFNILNRACDYCPVKDQCRKYWTDEQNKCIPAIENIDPKQACVQMGYCNASTLCSKMGIFQEECEHVLNKFIQSSKQESDELTNGLPKTSVKILTSEETTKPVDDSKTTCIMCEYAMKILVNYIHKDATEEEIQKSLEQVCQRMPSNLRKPCDEFVDNYGAAIIATVLQDADLTKLCQKLNICTKTMNVNVESLSKPNMAACGVCDYVSTYVHFALKRDPSDASLQEALSKVCTHLSKEQTSQCEMLVQLFGSQMRHLQLDLGENFCQQLAICEQPTENSQHVLDEGSFSIADNIENREKLQKNLDDSPQCLVCRYAVSYLDAVLKNNKSQEAIEEALEKVCKLLPAKERAQCNEFIKTYGPVLAELISEMADPDAVCRYLGVCQVIISSQTSTNKIGHLGGDGHDYIHSVVQQTPFTCTICQFIITRMKSLIASNQTEEEILASLKTSCDLFTVVHLKQQCQDFLEKYGPYLIQMVSSDIEPKEACQNIGACEKSSPSNTYEIPKTTSPPKSTSSVPSKCVFGMSYWCTSRKNAELCNAVELCERLVWSSKSKNIAI